jgi:hypothetical protein
LSFYKSQGFSRRSACLALISGIRFNPEDGKHLATYILVDRKLLKPKDNEPSALSAELPMSLPSCFKERHALRGLCLELRSADREEVIRKRTRRAV